jgi:hypothetical protein
MKNKFCTHFRKALVSFSLTCAAASGVDSGGPSPCEKRYLHQNRCLKNFGVK